MSLIANVAGAVGLALVVDGAIASLGWSRASDARAIAGAPPGVVVGSVWVVLFGFMGAARALVLASPHPRRSALARAIVAVLTLCALYPAYTGGLKNLVVAEVGNVATFAAVTVLCLSLRHASRRAATLVFPTVAWLAFATAIVAGALIVDTLSPKENRHVSTSRLARILCGRVAFTIACGASRRTRRSGPVADATTENRSFG